MQAAKGLGSLHICPDLPKSSLLTDVISTKILCTGQYEGCSNMNASSFIAFFTYMLEQNGKRFYKGLYATFKLTQDLKKNAVYFIEL